MAGLIKPVGGSDVPCTFVKCVFPSMRTRVETFVRRGYDGYGVVTDSLGDSDFLINVVFFGGQTSVGEWIENIEALQGRICTVTNDLNNTSQNNILIQNVGPPTRTVAIRHTANPDDDGYRAMFTIQAKRLFNADQP